MDDANYIYRKDIPKISPNQQDSTLKSYAKSNFFLTPTILWVAHIFIPKSESIQIKKFEISHK